MSDRTVDKPTLLIALGGNALVKKGQEGTAEQQFENLRTPIRQVARLSMDHRIIITHGNGPQVGNLLLQQEACDEVPELPLEILVAQTEGQIGYMIESTLDEELMRLGINEKPLVSLITYVVVDKDDPAFQDPTKPIGPNLTEKEASAKAYPTRKTSRGYRRVVASPEPVTIVEKREIKRLIDLDFIVICCGGGGIPVIREGRAFQGIDAVIDKDLASVRLAEEVGVDIFVIATDVEGVMVNFGKVNQRILRKLTLEYAADLVQKDQFGAGSMLPKVKAATRFVKNIGNRAVITSTEHIEQCVREANIGTEFVSDRA